MNRVRTIPLPHEEDVAGNLSYETRVKAAKHGLHRRPELDQFLGEAQARAAAGTCDGSCAKHQGVVEVVRTMDDRIDWGWFSYCQEAREEDQRRGYETLSHKDWAARVETGEQS